MTPPAIVQPEHQKILDGMNMLLDKHAITSVEKKCDTAADFYEYVIKNMDIDFFLCWHKLYVTIYERAAYFQHKLDNSPIKLSVKELIGQVKLRKTLS